MRTSALAWVVLLGGCGLLEPPAPPARIVGSAPDVPGAAIPTRPEGIGVAPPFPGWHLLWHDEFEGTALDEGRWRYSLEGTWRDAVNARDAIVVGDGLLSLVTFTAAGGVTHAPHITTAGTFETTYGYFEARVRFLDSRGEWCSFFLFDDAIGNPKGDPGKAGVEMDIYEHRHFDDQGFDMRDVVQVGINWDGFDKDWKRHNRVVGHPTGAPLAYEWHTYAMLWTSTGVTFYIDDLPVFASSKAVSHRPESIYLTCEVRNGSWAGYVPPGGYGSRERSTTRVEVDWVRVWQP